MNPAPRRTIAAPAVVAAILAVLVVATLSASLIGGDVFSSGDNLLRQLPFAGYPTPGFTHVSNFLLTDPVTGFVPDLLQIRADLSHGTLPLWTSAAGGGRPLFASQVTSPLFPLTWLSFLLPFFSSLAWVAAGKLILAALGSYLYVRELGLRRGPAMLAGVTFAWSMFFVVWLEHPQTDVWLCLPWMFLATRRLCATGSLGATALLGVSTGLAWLGGHPESAAFQVAATAAYAAFELLAERRTAVPASAGSTRWKGSRWKGPGWAESVAGRAGLVVAGLVLGVGMSAVVDLPLMELLHQSGATNRGGPALSMSAVYSFFFPELWGMPNKASAMLPGPVNFNERTGYFGALPLLLAAGAVGRRRPREVWFFVALVVVSFAVTFNIPLLADGIRKLPGANVARLTRFLIVLSFGAAVLAGYGLQRWLVGTAEQRRRILIVGAVVAVIPPLYWMVRHPGSLSSLGVALGQLPTVHFAQTAVHVIEVASVLRWILVCVLGLGLLAAMSHRRGSWPAAVALTIVALTAADLVTLDRGYHGAIPQAWADPPIPPALRYMAAHQDEGRIVSTELSLAPNEGERYGLRDARVGIDIPFPSRYDRLWAAFGEPIGDSDFFFSSAPGAHRLADLFAVRYALLPPTTPIPRWLSPVLRTAGGTVARNRTALPRAWVAYNWRNAHGSGSALSIVVVSSTRQLRQRPVLEGVGPPPVARTPLSNPASVTDDSSEQVTVHAVAKRAGYLVLDDSAFPGWEATVNGRSVAWHPANENFRAVPVPQGRDTVVFRYRPASVRNGAIVSIVCLLLLLGLAGAGILTSRRRRDREAPDRTQGDRAGASSSARSHSRESEPAPPAS